MQGYLGVGDQLQVDIDDLIARDLIAVDDEDSVAMTEDGERVLADAKEVGGESASTDPQRSVRRAVDHNPPGPPADDAQHRREVLAPLSHGFGRIWPSTQPFAGVPPR